MKEQRSRSLKQRLKEFEEELELLHTIVDTVWSELELENVLERTVNLVREYMGADSCLLYLYDLPTKTLKLKALASAESKNCGPVELKLGEGITGWAAARKKMVVIDEKSYLDSRFKPIASLKEDTFESFLSVPLIFKGELIGVLNIQHKEPHRHTSRELRLIETIAQQVAGAIANARLYRDLKEKVKRLEVLYEISNTLVSSVYLEEFLVLVLSMAEKVFNSAYNALLVYEKEEGKFISAMVYPDNKCLARRLTDGSLARFFFRPLAELKPIQEPDIMSAGKEWQRIAEEFSLRSVLAVPVAVRKEPLGVLVLFTSFPHAFTGEEVGLAKSFADQSALLIKTHQTEDRALKLEKKLNERKLVDRAKGILMEKHGMSESEAYEFLRKQSMNLRKSLGEVAEAVITYAEIKTLDG